MDHSSLHIDTGEFGNDMLRDDLCAPTLQQWLAQDRPFDNNLSPVGFNPLAIDYPFDFQSNPMEWRSNGRQSECDTAPADSGYGSAIPPSLDTMGDASPYSKPSVNFPTDDVGDQLAGFHLNMPEMHLMQDQASRVCQFQRAYHSQHQHQEEQLQYQHHIPNHTNDTGFWCHPCNKAVKTKSELKKHEARHNLPHKCTVDGCKRGDKGFASVNDLNRHRMTVHKQHALGRTYRCNIDQCSTKPKTWARADNFRSHLLRIHKRQIGPDHDLSMYLLQNPDPQAMDDDLSEIGSQPQFQANVTGPPPPTFHTIFQQPSHDSMHGTPGHGSAARSVPESTKMHSAQFIMPQASNAQISQPNAVHWTQTPALTVESSDSSMRNSHTLMSHADSSMSPTANASPKQEPFTPDQAFDSFEQEPEGEPDSLSIRSYDDEQQTSLEPQQPKPTNNSPLNQDSLSSEQMQIMEILKKVPESDLCRIRKALSASTHDKEERRPLAVNKGARCRCTECSKAFNRPCELKKHMKRHNRPYACTIPNCDKRFGSKNDWKRHEGSQHEIKELWLCDLGCNKLVSHREVLQAHLDFAHSDLNKASVGEKMDNSRTGLHCEPSYWCGFCAKMMRVIPGKKFVTERADHIDRHFMGRQDYEPGNIEAWKRLEDHFEYVPDIRGKRKRSSEETSSSSRRVKQPNRKRSMSM